MKEGTAKQPRRKAADLWRRGCTGSPGGPGRGTGAERSEGAPSTARGRGARAVGRKWEDFRLGPLHVLCWERRGAFHFQTRRNQSCAFAPPAAVARSRKPSGWTQRELITTRHGSVCGGWGASDVRVAGKNRGVARTALLPEPPGEDPSPRLFRLLEASHSHRLSAPSSTFSPRHAASLSDRSSTATSLPGKVLCF